MYIYMHVHTNICISNAFVCISNVGCQNVYIYTYVLEYVCIHDAAEGIVILGMQNVYIRVYCNSRNAECNIYDVH